MVKVSGANFNIDLNNLAKIKTKSDITQQDLRIY